MPLRELVAGLELALTDTDRRLIDTLLAHPRETPFLSANEVAQRARVNPATAVRFARKLGFDGYPALRARLQQELFGESEAADRMRQRIRRLGRGSVLKTFIEGEIRNLSRLPEQVADRDIMAAARAVARAGQTFLFAVGHAVALAHLLEARLGRAGYRTQILKHVPRDLATQLLQASSGDAFILFALNTQHPLLPRVVAQARAARARTILITDITGPVAGPRPDVTLAASRGAVGEPRSLTVPMTLCNTLVLHLSRLDQGRTLRNLERLDALRRALEARA